MMKIVHLYLEHPIMQLNSTFTYLLPQDQSCQRGQRVQVDFNGQKLIGFVDDCQEIDSLEDYEARLGYHLKPVEAILDEQPLLNEELYQLGLWMSHQTVSPVISCFQSMLPSSLKPSSNAAKVVCEKWVHVVNPALFEAGFPIDLPLKELKNILSDYKITKYRKSGELTVYDKEKSSVIAPMELHEAPYELTDEQKQALKTIRESDRTAILLHGLTGSGKTEIYLQLARETIEQGRQVLVLVPEISLTSQMIRRFRSRFSAIAVYHSGLSASEKYQQYQSVRKGQVQLVVGTRSSVFMPFSNIGLIIMDEEHDNSYKQDSTPRYNTRDIALKRCEYHQARLIMGSATPTLESYARAYKGVYQLVKLDQRINHSLPKPILVDMAQESRKGNFILSSVLQQGIRERLEKKQQVILLLNRRGYTPIMKCGHCGEVISCPNCDLSLSYHKDEEKMVCHCCGHSEPVSTTCPKCGKTMFKAYGVGTQRLQEEVQKRFPQARIIRMDADSTRAKEAHDQLLSAFGNQEADILIGTQMISKGLDFPQVTLVGILNADAPLARTDYRSVEMTFDLIVQAAGRSGRASEKGEVIIQAYDTSHYAIALAMRQDYIRFFNTEMSYRHAGKYPPYRYLAAICFASNDKEFCRQQAFEAAESFRARGLRALGPSGLLRKKNEHRYRIVIKAENRDQMLELLWQWLDEQAINKRKMTVSIDIDPYIMD